MECIKTGERNEALNLEMYCLAALYILGPSFMRSLPECAAALCRRTEAPPQVDRPAALPTARRRGWVDGWRG